MASRLQLCVATLIIASSSYATNVAAQQCALPRSCALSVAGVLGATLLSHQISPALATDYTTDGCPCYGDCARTIDGFFTPWCYTSPTDPPSDGTYCGKFSSTRRAYWAECIVNVTGVSEHYFLTTFNDMTTVMLVSSTALCGALYCIAGCIASLLTSPQRTVLWLPLASMMLGACQGFFIGAPFAVILSFLYLSIPYAIDFQVAVSLGLAVAVMVVYLGMGRHHKPFEAPHASEYE